MDEDGEVQSLKVSSLTVHNNNENQQFILLEVVARGTKRILYNLTSTNHTTGLPWANLAKNDKET
jgi:hypothetical protein